jgi:hypothetical protein
MKPESFLLPLITAGFVLSACARTVPQSELPLGAGFRYSTYGPGYDPGPEYWLGVGQKMSANFPGSKPQAIWIVGNFAGQGAFLTFPGRSDDKQINFSPKDNNEAALTLFDENGVDVWLQVEPGDVPLETLIDILLAQYGHHPCIIGVGVDVEWFHSDGTPEGRAVTDEEARSWVRAVRRHNKNYMVFLKHWEIGMMPPTYRNGLFFVDDSQFFESLDEMAAEFAEWGQAFAPSPVGFQFGYYDDKKWWGQYENPPQALGEAILQVVPNTKGLFWVDFTALQVFPRGE